MRSLNQQVPMSMNPHVGAWICIAITRMDSGLIYLSAAPPATKLGMKCSSWNFDIPVYMHVLNPAVSTSEDFDLTCHDHRTLRIFARTT